MEFILPMIFGFLSIPFWIFLSIGLYIFFEKVVFNVNRTKNQSYKVFLIAFCATIPVLGSLSIMVGPSILYDYSLHLDKLKRSKKAHSFWSEFFGSNLEKRLYGATDESDPSVKEFQQMLEKHRANVTFKIGPTHDGRREMAFVNGDMWPNDLVSRDLAYAASEIGSLRWLIGIGFTKPNPKLRPILHCSAHNQFQIKDDDFHFHVKNSGDDLDLIVYTDASLEWNKGALVDTFLDEVLGSYIYHYVLNRVEIKEMAERLIATETVSLADLYSECRNKLTQKHHDLLNNIIVTESCVASVPEVISTARRAMGITWISGTNKYLPEMRHRNGIWSELKMEDGL